MKNKYTQEMENKNLNENSQEEKVLALCEKCDYCDEGTVFKGVLDVLSAFANGMRVHGVIAISVNDIFW